MVQKDYNWKDGAELDDHSKKKHEILETYFREYLLTRCQLPKQEKFRLAIVDGFSGAGLYNCGSYGSPIIFVQTLVSATSQINLGRMQQGLKPVQIDCLLIFNDFEKDAIEGLKKNIAPHLISARDYCDSLFITTEYRNQKFGDAYPEIKAFIKSRKYTNVIFNLDQCGYSKVEVPHIHDILRSWQSSEVILTFAIRALLTYLSTDEAKNRVSLDAELSGRVFGLLSGYERMQSKPQWLGDAEKVVFDYLKECAPYVSPFSINNPSGWDYWLMHFANSYRARQVFNNVLHQGEATQVHYGRHGLQMLSYDPRDELDLYLFNDDSRESSKKQLYDDIPRLVSCAGDTMTMMDFYAAAYSETPAHSDDIHEMIIKNPDIEVITESGGARRVANTIKPDDLLRLKSQRTMFFMHEKN